MYHLDPPVTPDEIHAASLQFVRKISGYSKPSMHNEAAFNNAVKEIEAASIMLLAALRTDAPTRTRHSDHSISRTSSIKNQLG